MKTVTWIPVCARINGTTAYAVATRSDNEEQFTYLKSRGKSPRILKYATFDSAKVAADRANKEKRKPGRTVVR